MTDFQKRVQQAAEKYSLDLCLRNNFTDDDAGMARMGFLAGSTFTRDEVLRLLEESRGEDGKSFTYQQDVGRESLRAWLIERLRG